MRIAVATSTAILGLIVCGCAASHRDPLREESVAISLYNQAVEGGYRLIGTEELAELVRSQTDMVLLDVRPEGDFQRAHILGSTNIPFPKEGMKEWDQEAMNGMSSAEFADELGVAREMPIVVYAEDLDSPRSHSAAAWARQLGFGNVSRYAGGIRGWKAAGHETRSIDAGP